MIATLRQGLHSASAFDRIATASSPLAMSALFTQKSTPVDRIPKPRAAQGWQVLPYYASADKHRAEQEGEGSTMQRRPAMLSVASLSPLCS